MVSMPYSNQHILKSDTLLFNYKTQYLANTLLFTFCKTNYIHISDSIYFKKSKKYVP